VSHVVWARFCHHRPLCCVISQFKPKLIKKTLVREKKRSRKSSPGRRHRRRVVVGGDGCGEGWLVHGAR
jgi:hypothetical protein